MAVEVLTGTGVEEGAAFMGMGKIGRARTEMRIKRRTEAISRIKGKMRGEITHQSRNDAILDRCERTDTLMCQIIYQ